MLSPEYCGIVLLAYLLGPVSSFLVAPRHHGVVVGASCRSSIATSSSDASLASRSTSRLHSTSTSDSSQVLSDERRKVLLTRKGPYFQIDRTKNLIEFGATANLVTDLVTGGEAADSIAATISDWLLDEQGLALSIWDPKLTTELGNNVYRLQTMSLQFVTIQLAPTVDLEMKTILPNGGAPTFMLKSVGFDPNIQILPGMRFDASSLGIVIETAGILRQSTSREGSVSGLIAFQTTGQLPAFLRIVPEAVLRAASDSINQTIVKFAVDSFQTGAKRNFQQFVKRRSSPSSSSQKQSSQL